MHLTSGMNFFAWLLGVGIIFDIVGGAAPNSPAAVVLLGPSGSGKSETGNTLLDNIGEFTVSAGLESQTRAPGASRVTYEGREWQIVDTPGYLDTSLTPAQLDELLAQFADVVIDHIVALVFVVPYGRFGDAHMRAWRLSRGAFGSQSLKFAALAFTNCGDRSEADVRAEIVKICSGPTPPAVCTVVGQLEDASRILAFGKLESERRALDRSRLFELATGIESINGGRGYSHGDFRRTRERRKLMAKRMEGITSEEDRRLLGLLFANVESGAQTDEELLHALEKAEGLGETVRVVVDFEDRTLGPFYQVGAGWRQPMPVPYDSMRGYMTASGSGAHLFLHTGTDSGVRLRHGDKRVGELRSRPFFLGSGDISWEATGSGGFIALCPADPAVAAAILRAGGDVTDLEEDGAAPPASGCLERRVRRESQELARGSLSEDDLLHLRGSAVYLRVVDDRPNGWGFVALDNLAYPSVVFAADSNSTENSTDAPPLRASQGLTESGSVRLLESENAAITPATPDANTVPTPDSEPAPAIATVQDEGLSSKAADALAVPPSVVTASL